MNVSKPKFLYHGSRKKLKILMPQQAAGDAGVDNLNGIYAIEDRRIAEFFTLSMTGLDSNARFNIALHNGEPYLTLFRTELDWSRQGYLYTVHSEYFERVDETQWLSTRQVKPEMIEIIDPIQLKDKITIIF